MFNSKVDKNKTLRQTQKIERSVIKIENNK